MKPNDKFFPKELAICFSRRKAGIDFHHFLPESGEK
jgi:hypothetical protein